MHPFSPCKGKTACRDDGEKCLVCERSFAEITRTGELIDALADLACAHDYDNVSEFAAYIARKLEKKVRHRRQLGGNWLILHPGTRFSCSPLYGFPPIYIALQYSGYPAP
jgi:hypothetical protein